jgi:hypothetical protein
VRNAEPLRTLLPLVLAEMVTGPPAATAVTSPVCETAAIKGSLLAQFTDTSGWMIPLPLVTVAPSWVVSPTFKVARAGLTSTIAPGWVRLAICKSRWSPVGAVTWSFEQATAAVNAKVNSERYMVVVKRGDIYKILKRLRADDGAEALNMR